MVEELEGSCSNRRSYETKADAIEFVGIFHCCCDQRLKGLEGTDNSRGLCYTIMKAIVKQSIHCCCDQHLKGLERPDNSRGLYYTMMKGIAFNSLLLLFSPKKA